MLVGSVWKNNWFMKLTDNVELYPYDICPTARILIAAGTVCPDIGFPGRRWVPHTLLHYTAAGCCTKQICNLPHSHASFPPAKTMPRFLGLPHSDGAYAKHIVAHYLHKD